MKRMIYILAVVMAVGCHHSMDPWPGDGDKQDVAMYVRTRSLSGITASPSVYQFFPDFVNVSPKNHLQIMGRYVDVVS